MDLCGKTKQTQVRFVKTQRGQFMCVVKNWSEQGSSRPPFFEPRRAQERKRAVYESRAFGPECEGWPRDRSSCRCPRLVATLPVFGSRVVREVAQEISRVADAQGWWQRCISRRMGRFDKYRVERRRGGSWSGRTVFPIESPTRTSACGSSPSGPPKFPVGDCQHFQFPFGVRPPL